jgi:uncharacterized oligopeptide transporter (OPT) family protein
VLDQSLPWALIFIGVGIAGVAAIFRVPTLPFAVGVYLPLSTMGAVFLGGLLRWYLTRGESETAEVRREKGVLFGSGLVGGGGLTGVLLAIWVVVVRGGEPIIGFPPNVGEVGAMVLAAVTIGLGLGAMGYYATRSDEA